MNYLKITNNDIANGPGVRVVLWVSGCSLHCEGCHNECSWDFDAGKPFTESVKKALFEELSHDYVTGLTLTGGHPLEPRNLQTIEDIVFEFREKFPNKTIWLYTGYTWEHIFSNIKMLEVCSLCDVIVDGPYKADERDVTLAFRGSRNQRIIDVRRSLDSGEIKLVDCE